MKKVFFAFFTRFSAVLVLLVFTYTSCSHPFTAIKESDGSKPFDPLNPGEGTAAYSYIDADGNVSDIDYGRTLFTVEDNKYAEGVFIYADDIEDNRRVTILYEDITITMFFEDDSGFPTSMYIPGSTEKFKGYFSSYNEETQTYNIVIEQNNNYDMLRNIYLDKSLLAKYQYNPEMTPSQNNRVRNYTASLSVYYSLYNFFESSESTRNISSARSLKSVVSGLVQTFIIIAVIVVSVIVICDPPLIIIVPILLDKFFIPPIVPTPTLGDTETQEEKLIIELKWADDPRTITSPKDLLHVRTHEYTVHVEIYGGNWDENKLDDLINKTPYAYSPGEEYKSLSTLSYFDRDKNNDNKPYKIIVEDPSNCKKFDIKFTRAPLESNSKTELRIGLVFPSKLVIIYNDFFNDVDVKFFGNIDDDPYYTSVEPEKNPYINETYTNFLTMRFCLFHPSECIHLQ